MKVQPRTFPRCRGTLLVATRLYAGALLTAGAVAQAQTMGQGLFQWAIPFILMVGGGGIIIGLVTAYIAPQHLMKVVWGLLILVAIFAVIRGMGSLYSAVQQG